MRYLKDVVTLALDQGACVGCGVCTEVCPHGVFRVADRKAHVVDRDACIECGACARNCPVQAITVQAGVGCATGIMQTALGLKSECCTDKQGCGCSPTKADKEGRIPPARLGVSGAVPAPAGCTETPQTLTRRNDDMSSTNDDRKPTDNTDALKQQASACEPGCCCHAAGASGRTRWVLGAIILLAAAALAARAVLKGNGASTPPATAAFAAPQNAACGTAPATAYSLPGQNSAPAPAAATTAPTAPAPTDAPATTTPTLETPPAAPGTAPSPSAATDATATAVAQTSPATASVAAAPADGASKASESDLIVGKEISGFADLNTVAADTTAVFVFLPAKTPDAGKPPTAQMQGAARTIEAQGKKVGLFTLKTGSRDYDQIAAQMSVPGVLALVKGRGMKAVEGEITETKLIQGFVAASSAGGCGAASGGCGPSGCK